MALTPCTDLSAAAWIVDSEVQWDQLVGFGPSGLPAYARLRFLPDPAFPGQSENDVQLGSDAPSETEQLRTVVDMLAHYTSTPDQCYFCLWEGWGSDINGGDFVLISGDVMPTVYRDTDSIQRGPRTEPAFPPWVLEGRKVIVPHRAYYLFQGKLADFGDWGAVDMWPGQPRLHMPDPAFIWPADHAWCVVNDVDPHWAGIGADTSAIAQLIADPRLDVVPADPHQDPPRYR